MEKNLVKALTTELDVIFSLRDCLRIAGGNAHNGE